MTRSTRANKIAALVLAAHFGIVSVIPCDLRAHDFTLPGGTGPGQPGDPDDQPPCNNPSGGNPDAENASDPVNLDDGEFTMSAVDLSIPARGLPLSFMRQYRSRSAHDVALGYGWEFNWRQRVHSFADDSAMVITGFNRKDHFVPDYFAFWDDVEAGPALFTPDAPWAITQTDSSSPESCWTDSPGGLYANNANVSLTTVPFDLSTATAPRLRFAHRHAFLAGDVGRVEYSINGGAFTQLVQFTGTASGWLNTEVDLASLAGQSNVRLRWRLATSLSGQADGWYVDDVTVSRGVPTSGPIVYRAPRGVPGSLVRNADGTYTLGGAYGVVSRFDADGKVTRIEDRRGNALTFQYDARARLPIVGASRFFAAGQTRGVVALDHRLTSVTDALGRRVDLEYDADGRISRIEDFGGREWSYGYDPATDDLVTVTDPLGQTITYGYDASHRLTSIRDKKGVTYLTNVYDGQGRVTSQTLGGDTATYDYNADRTTDVTDRNGFNSRFTFDGKGRVTRVEKFTDGDPVGEPASYVSTIQYGPSGEILRKTFPRGNAVEYGYDASGNVVEVRQKKIGATPFVDDPVGDVVVAYTYEPRFGRVKTVTGPRGTTVTYVYDYELPGGDPDHGEQGNLVRHRLPAVAEGVPETRISYNAFGQAVTKRDPNGNVTKYEYDAATGYLERVVNAFGTALEAATEFGTDAFGNVTSITNANGDSSAMAYDAGDRLIRMTDVAPFGFVQHFDWDANGNLVQVDRQATISPPGARPPLGSTSPADDWRSTVFSYDSLDRLTTVRNDLGTSTSNTWDTFGNRLSYTSTGGKRTEFEYDERGLLAKVVDAASAVWVYGRDENGNVSSLTDAKSNVTTYELDDFDRIARITYDDGTFETFAHDKSGNLTSYGAPDGGGITYAFDALDRLDLKTYSGGGAADFGYDLGSRLVSLADASGGSAFVFDALNRATSVTQTIGSISKTVGYQYDPMGNRTRLTYPDGDFLTYEFDALNRLDLIRDSVGATIADYDWDALDRRSRLAIENGSATTYQYDGLSHLLDADVRDAGAAPLFRRTYTYDANLNRRTCQDGAGIHSYGYDDLNQLTSVDHPAAFAFADTSFDYDALGNRVDVTAGGTTSYVTNGLNQYSSVGGVSFQYDPNGNLTDDGTNVYSYDRENRLTGVATPSGAIGYAYDAFFRRVTRTAPGGATTHFFHDGDQVLFETDASGAITAKYVYGPTLDEPVRVERGGSAHYYHVDAQGSVVGLTDSAGAVAETYAYDVYGAPEVRNAGGTVIPASAVGNTILFTGREYDTEAGLYYNRTRHYRPDIGRFLTRDEYPPQIIDTLESANRYHYVANSPADWADPFGFDKDDGGGWLDWLQTGLDIAGLVPVVGEVFDLANAGIYAARGDYLNAGLSAASAIPLIGYGATGTKLAVKTYKAADLARGGTRVGEGVYEFVGKRTGRGYVGQSGNVSERMGQHIRSGKVDPNANVRVLEEMPGSSKLQREIREQQRIDELGGIDNLENKVNPIGENRRHLMGEPNSGGGNTGRTYYPNPTSLFRDPNDCD